MIDPEFESQYGFSLAELLVVVVILGVLAAFAIIALGNSTSSIERQNVAKQFKISLERARFDSVKRRADYCENMSRVEITSATSFTLLTDANQNGALEPDMETRTIKFSSQDIISIVADPPLTYPIVIRFDKRGNASSGACGAETAVNTPTIFCTMPCTAASANASNSNVVFVSRTGTVALMGGGSDAPAFTAPAIGSIDNSNQINPMLVVWDVPTATANTSPTTTVTPAPDPTAAPTPDATATPTPHPTATPSPDPSVTPTPSSSATPAPTPRWCNLGEQPAVNNCACSPTQYLQAGSGKCRSL